MLLIVLGIVIIVLTAVRVIKTPVKSEDILKFSMIHAFITVFGLLVLFTGVGAPLHGYHDPVVVKEYELVELIEDSDVYIIEDSNRTPFFKYITDSDKTRINNPYNQTNLDIDISGKYKEPTLVEYRVKPKKGIFGIGLFINTVEYKIYAAEKNIKRFE